MNMKTFKVTGTLLMLGALMTSSAIHASQLTNAQSYAHTNTLVPAGVTKYHASEFPDRVVVVPGENASSTHYVNWRTNAQTKDSVVEITVAQGTPGLHLTARSINGSYTVLETENGLAHHHNAVLSDLEPDTLYAYRVKGDNTWSEWFQFRTPASMFEPYSAVYFGDAQNAVKAYFSRTVREAVMTAPRARLMIHAGDLVNSRDGIHDDEWGEWFDAMSWSGASVSQLPVPGNHEFIEDENEYRHLVEHWEAQFKVAGNGPEGLERTVYYTDFQGVRYISLDSMEALQNEENAKQQAAWLRNVLADNPNHWTVVVHHHPMFSVSLGRDNPLLRKHWLPIYEEFGVDLVLQGHDHTYGRGHNMSGTDAGPVYLVSVAGPKMYLVSEQAEARMQRNAEDVQLFQTLDFSHERLQYKSFTVTGELYDAFDIVRTESGATRIEDNTPERAEQRCANPAPLRETRCWNGTELIYAPTK